jgi:8-hydroxy-5-deazaflavin:NADPH oxidoreductase
MQIGVLGTGTVGQTIGSALVRQGHAVRMGSRRAGNPKAEAWVSEAGDLASQGTVTEAVEHSDEVVFNCTSGAASLDALRLAGARSLEGKILIDLANPLDFSRGMPPSLIVCNTDSLAERIQAALPATRVVKALNTVNSDVMVNPALVKGDHNVFVAGNDGDARRRVAQLLNEWFAWPESSVIDLGDITAARGLEMYLPLWVRLFGALGSPHLNIAVMRAKAS